MLAQSLQPGSLYALFRNSHLSVLYRRREDEASPNAPRLFSLVTDSAFIVEDGVVWESLEDVDGAASEFYDAKFQKASIEGGDWVGARDRRQAGGRAGNAQGGEEAE